MTEKSGYVFGCNPAVGFGGHLWMTVPGSAHRRIALAATPDQAEKYAPFADTLALVERVNSTAFRVLEIIKAGER